MAVDAFTVRLEDQLKTHGLDVSLETFYDLLRSELAGQNVDELLCNPPAASSFANKIKMKLETPLPTELILRALLNLRKSNKLDNSSEE